MATGALIVVLAKPIALINKPIRYPGLKPAVFPGLILSGALAPI